MLSYFSAHEGEFWALELHEGRKMDENNDLRRTKSEFRALRERVGLTRDTLADILGVTVRSVRYWESLDSLRYPPDDAWHVLDDALEHQRAIVAYTLDVVAQMIRDEGEKPAYVTLPYWLCRKDYEEGSEDSKYGLNGDWHMANANALAVSILLEAQGIEVRWIDFNPSEDIDEDEE